MAEGFFRAGADPSSPDSYQQLELRKRIAMAMLGQGGKKGYPKNVGEGLTAIGDALGERGMMSQLMDAQRSEDARRAAIPSLFPAPPAAAGGALPSAIIPGPRADASPQMPTIAPTQADASAAPAAAAAAPASWLSGAVADNADYQPADALPPVQDAGGAPALASADTGTMSDAAPVGAPTGQPNPAAVRASISQLMQARQVGPQQNPMLAGQQPASLPSAFSPEDLGSPPDAATNRPIVADITTQPRATDFSAQSRRPSDAPPMVYKQPVPPTPPDRTPESKAQIQFTQEAIRRRGMGEDPAIVDYFEKQAGELEKDRAQKDAVKLREYESERAKHNQEYEQWKTQQTPKWQAEQAAEIAKADIVRRSGGMTPEQFFPKMDLEQSTATQALKAQDAQQLARKAIREGVITGYGANFRVAMDKFANWGLKNGLGTDLAANTETMSAALKSGLSEAIQTINGTGGRVSDADVRIAQGIQGTDPQLQMKTIKDLMDRASEINNMKINKYEEMVHKYLGGHPQELNYATNPRPTAPPEHLKMLLEAPPEKAPAMRKFFDEVYGPGAADLETGRNSRRQRRGGG